MKGIDAILQERVGRKEATKVQALATQSATGQRSSFQGFFAIKELTTEEKTTLHLLLDTFRQSEEQDISKDFEMLTTLTAEVKAITNQAVLLHGQRIQIAQTLLKRYKEGAFSQWLIKTYGNRQTPYNFLLYYEFHEALSVDLRKKLEDIPRQAIYVLASRSIAFEKKQEIVASYEGQTKEEMLKAIRSLFPLLPKDKRRSTIGQSILVNIEKQVALFQKFHNEIGEQECQQILQALKKFLFFLKSG